MRIRLTLGVLLVGGLVLGEVGRVRADDSAPSEPRYLSRAVVVVVPEGEVEPFVEAYMYEAAAAGLRARSFWVAPPHATRAQGEKHAAGRSLACAQDVACVRSYAAAFSASMVLFVRVATVDRRRSVSVVVEVVRLREGATRRDAVLETEDAESDAAALVRQAAEEAAAQGPPCQVSVRASSQLPLSLRLDRSEMAVRAFPMFLDAGKYELAIEAEGRTGWQGPLQCEPGRRYQVRVQ